MTAAAIASRDVGAGPAGRPLRVLHVLLTMDVGGAEVLVSNWVRALDPSRYACEICCLRHLGELGPEMRDDGYPVHVLEAGGRLATIRRLRRLVQERRIDVVHAHQYTPFFFAALATWGLPTRLIYTEHGRILPDRVRPKRWVVNPWLARRADHIVSIAESTREAMVRLDNVPRSRIEVIHNGVKIDATPPQGEAVRHELGIPAAALVVGMAARLVELKNLPLAAAAFAAVAERHPAATLVVAGDGPARPALEAALDEHGIAGRARLLGMRDDLDRVIPAFDLLLISSRTEGISVTLLQAMAAGVPAVATEVGGNPEVVDHDRTGLLVPGDDVAAMAAAIDALLGDPARRRAMAAASVARAREAFDERRVLQRYAALYDGRGGD